MQDDVLCDHLGEVWMPDNYFHGAAGPPDSRNRSRDAGCCVVYCAALWSFQLFHSVAENGGTPLNCTLPNMVYRPASTGGVGSRVFDVYCNGTTS